MDLDQDPLSSSSHAPPELSHLNIIPESDAVAVGARGTLLGDSSEAPTRRRRRFFEMADPSEALAALEEELAEAAEADSGGLGAEGHRENAVARCG